MAAGTPSFFIISYEKLPSLRTVLVMNDTSQWFKYYEELQSLRTD